MKQSIFLGDKKVVSGGEPYVIAEIGVNHEGSFDLAKKLIDQAREGGADAAKFQTYKAETLASKDSPAYWDTAKESTKSQYELFKKYDSFNAPEYIELANYCRSVGIEFLSTPFDDESIEFLEPLVPFYKVASADLTNLPFLRKIAKKKKTVVLSTGASTLIEIDIALNELEKNGCPEVSLLHCVLNYPTENNNANLKMIESLRRSYPCHMIGYSDHTLPDETMRPLVAAYLLGATILEKHFTHDKTLPGNDHYHAMDQKDLRNFRTEVTRFSTLLGDSVLKAPLDSEQVSRSNARRSIVLKESVPAGHIFKEKDLTYKRPGSGISPLFWDKVIGMKALLPLEEDHILCWQDIGYSDE